MTIPALTARPPSAAIAWATPDAIFVEIPAKAGGPPFICRYKRTASGLAAALNILIQHEDATYIPLHSLNGDHPLVAKAKAAPKPRAEWASPDQRNAALADLRFDAGARAAADARFFGRLIMGRCVHCRRARVSRT